MAVRAALAGAFLCALLASAAAREEGATVVCASSDARLESALRAALVPWSLGVRAVAEMPPGSSLPAAVERARALAARHGGAAVVWISTDADGHALWVYDAARDQIVARALAVGPPLDEATAAAVALSVKTLLRSSAAAPPSERIDAADWRRVAPPRHGLRVEAGLGPRLRPGIGALEPRLRFALSWWRPASFGTAFGAAAMLQGGPGFAIDDPRLVGRFAATAFGLGARARLDVGRRAALDGSLSATLHFTSLDGSARVKDVPVHVSRVNPSVDLGLAAGAMVGEAVELGIIGEAAIPLRRQEYLVRGEPVLSLPAIEIEIGVRLAVRWQ